jgi:SRSO17 transposase
MDGERTIANIGRKTEVSGQNLQHFISNSPWSGPGLIKAVQQEIRSHPAFCNAILVLDESAEEKSGAHSAGAARQHNGRLGKIAMSQVGVFLALVTPFVNTWIDGALYLPEHWFDVEHTQERRALGIPDDRIFQKKPEIGWRLIQRAQARGIPFQAVVMDDLYGRNEVLRQQLHQANIEYFGDVPVDTRVFLEEPHVYYPLTTRGIPSRTPQIDGKAYQVRDLQQYLQWHTLRLRPSERGYLQADFARCRVWVMYGTTARQEWLLVWKDPVQITYSLSNASEHTSLETMAWRKTHRYLIERSNQDAKGEIGWDEFQTRKYLAWEHQLALTILASWFIAETRLDWQQRFLQDPELFYHYEVEVLPQLSVRNIRELLRAALPLPQLSPQESVRLVISHLMNRTRSRKARLRKAKGICFD